MEVTKKDLERATRFIQNYGMNKEEVLAQIEGQPTATVKVKKLFKDVQLPLIATDGSAGADLRAYLYDDETNEKVTKIIIFPNREVKVHTGLCFQLPKGTAMLLLPRSSMGIKKDLVLKNTIGLLDCDYTGECLIFLKNVGDTPVEIEQGERLVQALIVPYIKPNFIEVEELDETERGAGGFGSTQRI